MKSNLSALMPVSRLEGTRTIYIPGGSVSARLSIVDTINLLSCDVSTVCVGISSSMGAIILMSGAKVKRKILLHSTVLIHKPLQNPGNTFHQTSDMEIYANDVRRTGNTLYSLIQECISQSLDKISRDCDCDYTLSAAEALEYVIVDEIISSHR